MLPGLDPQSGLLPRGEHVASWDEVVERFGWNERRRALLDGLAEALELLAGAGCQRVWLDGSFVASGLVFAEFFQNERDGTRKGIVVLRPGEAP